MASAPLATPANIPRGLMVLLCATLAGEAIHRALSLPVSGPVLGIMLLALLFSVRREVPASVEAAGAPMLRHLSVFFVPAGVGLMNQTHLLGARWPAIVAALLGSSALCLLATAFTLGGLDTLAARREPACRTEDAA